MSKDGGMTHITISGATPDEFFQRFGEVALRFGYMPMIDFKSPPPVGEPKFLVDEVVAESAAAPKKRVRRTRAQIEADENLQHERSRVREADNARGLSGLEALSAEEERDEIAEVLVESPPPTIEDVKMAGARLIQFNNGDPSALRALLAEYGLTKLKQLPEDKWAGFIQRCER